MAGAQGHAIYGRSEGSSPTGADHRATYLYSADPEDPDHDAVMRIGGEAPKRRVHSPQRLESHASSRRAATSERHRAPTPPSRSERAPNALLRAGALCCRTQDNAVRDLAGGHHAPEGDEQL